MNQKDLLQRGYRYAFSLTHNHHDAEDLVQDAWIRLCSKGEITHSKSLLFTTIRNRYIDQFRRNRLIVFEVLDQEYEFEDVEDSVEVTTGELDVALNSLRYEEREAVYLNYVEGYSAREISQLTQKSRNTVLSLLHRARQKLCKLLRHTDKERDLA